MIPGFMRAVCTKSAGRGCGVRIDDRKGPVTTNCRQPARKLDAFRKAPEGEDTREAQAGDCK